MSSIRDAKRLQDAEEMVNALCKRVEELELKVEVLDQIWENFRDTANLDPRDDKPIDIPDVYEDAKTLGYRKQPDPKEEPADAG